VQRSDTIESIAKACRVSADELREFNRLSAGQQPTVGSAILVPTPAIVSL
jgi:hypothetical protein